MKSKGYTQAAASSACQQHYRGIAFTRAPHESSHLKSTGQIHCILEAEKAIAARAKRRVGPIRLEIRASRAVFRLFALKARATSWSASRSAEAELPCRLHPTIKYHAAYTVRWVAERPAVSVLPCRQRPACWYTRTQQAIFTRAP